MDDGIRKAIEMLEISEMYELPETKNSSENLLISGIKVENAVDLLILAKTKQLTDLNEVAMKIIVEKSYQIVKQKGWWEKLSKFPALHKETVENVFKKK